MKETIITAIYTTLMDINHTTVYFWIGYFLVLGALTASFTVKKVTNLLESKKEVKT